MHVFFLFFLEETGKHVIYLDLLLNENKPKQNNTNYIFFPSDTQGQTSHQVGAVRQAEGNPK